MIILTAGRNMYTEKKAAELKVIFVNDYLHYKTHRCVTFLHLCACFSLFSLHTNSEQHAHRCTGHIRLLTNVSFNFLTYNKIFCPHSISLYIGHTRFNAKVFCDKGTLKMVQWGRNMYVRKIKYILRMHFVGDFI